MGLEMDGRANLSFSKEIQKDKQDGDEGNTIDAGAGSDVLYVVDTFNDVVIENPGEGTDTILRRRDLRWGRTWKTLISPELRGQPVGGGACGHRSRRGSRRPRRRGRGRDHVAGGSRR
jgi:hypothetical protein